MTVTRFNSLRSNHVRLFTRFVLFVFTVIQVMVFFAGCDDNISNSKLAYINTNLGNLAIVPEPLSGSLEYKPWATDPLSGFAKGAGEGVVGVGSNLHHSDFEGDFAAFAVLVLIAGGAAVGGTIGAFQAVPEDVSLEIEKLSLEFFNNRNINESIAHEVYINSLQTRSDLHPEVFKKTDPADGKSDDESKDLFYKRLRQAGKETILSIGMTDLIFEGGRGRKPAFPLHIEIHTELVSVIDKHIIFSKDYEYISEEYPWKSWRKDNGSLLVKELTNAYREIGKQIYTEQVEMPVHSIPFKSGFLASSAEVSGAACFFKPIDPALKLKGPVELIFNPEGGLYIKATQADSVQPVLKWESFPRPRDHTRANAEVIDKITDVAYDLRIWKRSKADSRIVVYERNMLTVPEHKVECGLSPRTDYFWSFRAHYKLDGQPRDIPWAFYNFKPNIPCKSCYCDIEDIPNHNLFRFKTPFNVVETK